LHAATIELAHAGGYRGLTVTGIARTAGVSNRTFYENFRGRDDCFLATYDLIVRNGARAVLAAQHREQDLEGKVAAGIVAFLHAVAENPKAAHFVLIEAPEASPTQERTQHTTGLFEALVSETFVAGNPAVGLPGRVAKGTIGGLSQVARSYLLTEAHGDLIDESKALSDWVGALGKQAKLVFELGQTAAPSRPREYEIHGKTSENGQGPSLAEREMILWAVSTLAASEGLEALTVSNIRRRFGIPRRRFEEYFADPTDCFLSAVESHFDRSLAGPWTASLDAGQWPESVYRALAGLCQELAANQSLRGLLFHALPEAGREGARWRARLISRLATSLYVSAPTEIRPSAVTAEASIAAGWTLLEAEATQKRPQRLPTLAGGLAYFVLAPIIGADEAVEVIQIDRAPAGAGGAHRSRGLGSPASLPGR
jgi:AcrR family transcriptional regulator